MLLHNLSIVKPCPTFIKCACTGGGWGAIKDGTDAMQCHVSALLIQLLLQHFAQEGAP